jgi:hypothetical protein
VKRRRGAGETGAKEMARAIILRTKDDDKVWLINLEQLSVSEIANASADDLGGAVLEADVIEAANMRTAAAAHPYFVVQ